VLAGEMVVLLRNVMGTFIGMSESHKGITTALKQLPTRPAIVGVSGGQGPAGMPGAG
jgi:hypothetical protein